MIREARVAGRVRLDNGASPSDTAGALGEADRADIQSFFEQVKQVLPILRLDLVRPQPRVVAVGTPSRGPIPGPIPRSDPLVDGGVESCFSARKEWSLEPEI